MSIRGLNELHATLVAHRTRITGLDPDNLALRFRSARAHRHRVRHQGVGALPQQGATLSQFGFAMPVSKKAKIADFVQGVALLERRRVNVKSLDYSK